MPSHTSTSKFLSFILRHKPEVIGLTLDEEGWADVGGLLEKCRQHVHLSPDKSTAEAVGRRHGQPVILVIDAGSMHAAGHTFFLSENGVWLTESVPVDYLAFPE